VLDIEWGGVKEIRTPDILEWCTEFLQVVDARLGRRPIIYTGPSFWKFRLGSATAFKDYLFCQRRGLACARRTRVARASLQTRSRGSPPRRLASTRFRWKT
jgi:hypothetical protein